MLASHPLGRFEAVALPDIGVFTINGVTDVEMARLPFRGAGYHVGALVRGVSMVENRLNEERLIFVQEEIVKPMAIAVCDKQRVFETRGNYHWSFSLTRVGSGARWFWQVKVPLLLRRFARKGHLVTVSLSYGLTFTNVSYSQELDRTFTNVSYSQN